MFYQELLHDDQTAAHYRNKFQNTLLLKTMRKKRLDMSREEQGHSGLVICQVSGD